MWTVLKKELKNYFLSPIGYVVIGIFLLCFSVFFYITVIRYLSVDLGGLYYNTAVFGLLIIVPLLTMRMFSEERKNGTEQLLLTVPTGMFSIVMGKFLAALAVILITLILSLMFFGIVSYFGEPSLGVTLAQMLGFLLVAMAAISCGMFASSLTENQIISGILSIAFLVISLFAGNVSASLSSLSLVDTYFINFAYGVISLENIISLLLFTFVFISLTIIVMKRRKLVK